MKESIRQSISGQLMYSTVRIEAERIGKNGRLKRSQGTGFFFQFSYDGHNVPFLVTSRHVVEGFEKYCFHLHVNDSNSSKNSFKEIEYHKAEWFYHPDLDLACISVAALFRYIKSKYNEDPCFCPITEDLVPDEKTLLNLKAVEDVIMVGYPLGLYDDVNNLPIFRKGITASHPAVDYRGKKHGAVDMACFDGSSGSPILILNEGVYSEGDKLMAGNRVIFLGIFCSGINPDKYKGINLGFYIKASEILICIEPFRKKLMNSSK